MSLFQVGVRPFGASPTSDPLEVSLHLPFQSNPQQQPKRDDNHPSQTQTQTQQLQGAGKGGEMGVNGNSNGLGESEATRTGPGLDGRAGVSAGENEEDLDSLIVEVRGQDMPLHGAVAHQSSGEWSGWRRFTHYPINAPY